MTENNNRDFGPHDSMSWNTSSLAWVFAANTRAALDDTVTCGTLSASRAPNARI